MEGNKGGKSPPKPSRRQIIKDDKSNLYRTIHSQRMSLSIMFLVGNVVQELGCKRCKKGQSAFKGRIKCEMMIQIKHKAQFQHSLTANNTTKAGKWRGKAALEVMLIWFQHIFLHVSITEQLLAFHWEISHWQHKHQTFFEQKSYW